MKRLKYYSQGSVNRYMETLRINIHLIYWLRLYVTDRNEVRFVHPLQPTLTLGQCSEIEEIYLIGTYYQYGKDEKKGNNRKFCKQKA